MILGYSPPRSRSILKRRFNKKYSFNQFINERHFKRSKLVILIQTVLFWVLMLFGLRIGSLTFTSLAPFAIRENDEVLVTPPSALKSKVYFKDKKNSIRIWIDNSNNLYLEDEAVSPNSFSNEVVRYNPDSKTTFIFADFSCRMEMVHLVISELRKKGSNRFIFITTRKSWGIWSSYDIEY